MRFLVVLVLALLSAPAAAQGLHVQGDEIVGPDGTPFLMRGINVPHAWLPERTEAALPAIAATGANTVRLVLSSGHVWDRNEPEEVRALIETIRGLGMVTMLEVHDATGWGQREGDARWTSLDEIVPYWLELLPALEGTESYAMINLANEPTGNGVPEAVWFWQHANAIQALREAGSGHVLVVDGANWGQDASGAMRRTAPLLAAADPRGDVVFSVHMYQVYARDQSVWSYVRAFETMDLPLIVGEFGMDHQGEPVAEDAIFAAARRHRVGYLGWSWSGNSRDVADLDIVLDFDPERLSPWGERLVNGSGGLRETSRPASWLTDRPLTLAERVRARRAAAR